MVFTLGYPGTRSDGYWWYSGMYSGTRGVYIPQYKLFGILDWLDGGNIRMAGRTGKEAMTGGREGMTD